jgi:hypothetical protein
MNINPMNAIEAIKITLENRELIEATLRKANGALTAHRFTQFSEVHDLSTKTEAQLLKMLGSASLAPGAACLTETIVMERHSSDWYLVAIADAGTYAEDGSLPKLSLTLAQKEAAMAHLSLAKAGASKLH